MCQENTSHAFGSSFYFNGKKNPFKETPIWSPAGFSAASFCHCSGGQWQLNLSTSRTELELPGGSVELVDLICTAKKFRGRENSAS